MVTLPPSSWPCPDLREVALLSSESLSSWYTMPLSTYLVQAFIAAFVVLFGVQMQTAAAQATPSTCVTVDQPNPIFSQYPNNATGLLNVTMAIIPISMTTARQIIPQQYGILEGAFRALMPDFPAGMYPVIVQAGHDHDIRFQDFQIPDFSVRSIYHMRARAGRRRLTLWTAESWLRVPFLGPSGRRRILFPMGARAIDLGHQRRGDHRL